VKCESELWFNSLLWWRGSKWCVTFYLRALSSKGNKLGTAKAKRRAGGLICVPRVWNKTFFSPAECQSSSTVLPICSVCYFPWKWGSKPKTSFMHWNSLSVRCLDWGSRRVCQELYNTPALMSYIWDQISGSWNGVDQK